MDFLNPLISQVRELFASMTPGARVTAGLLLAVVVVSLGFLFQKATTGPDEYLFGGDPIGRERLPRMEAAMSAAGIEYEVVGTRIKVSQANKNAAIAAIADAGELPPDFHSVMNDALNGGSPFEYRDQKMQRIRAADGARAELILEEIKWISKARVMHSVRARSGLQTRRHATAAVTITPTPGEQLTSTRARKVKDLISKACDVPIENITLANTNGDLFAGDDGVSAADFDNPYYKLKAMQEDRIESNLRDQLAFISGVRVKVNATLDERSERRETLSATEGTPVQLRTSSNKVKDSQTVSAPGEQVGPVANGPTPAPRDGQLARQNQSTRDVSEKESEQVVGRKDTLTVTAGFTLKEVDASVAIPLSYVEAVYNEENRDEDGAPPKTVDEQAFSAVRTRIKTDVEEIVQPLLPRLSLGENKYRQVNVKFFRDLPEDPIAGPSLASNALGWAGSHVNTLAMAGLAVFSLVMLRSLVNGAKEGPVAGLPALQLDGEPLADGGSEDDEEEARPKLKLRKPETLKDDLTDMVSSDPDAAAAILKSWINNAA